MDVWRTSQSPENVVKTLLFCHIHGACTYEAKSIIRTSRELVTYLWAMLPFLMSEMMRDSPGFLLAVDEDDITITTVRHESVTESIFVVDTSSQKVAALSHSHLRLQSILLYNNYRKQLKILLFSLSYTSDPNICFHIKVNYASLCTSPV